MASPTSQQTEATSDIAEAFVVDRQVFWASFTTFVFRGAIAIAVLLVGMWFFLA